MIGRVWKWWVKKKTLSLSLSRRSLFLLLWRLCLCGWIIKNLFFSFFFYALLFQNGSFSDLMGATYPDWNPFLASGQLKSHPLSYLLFDFSTRPSIACPFSYSSSTYINNMCFYLKASYILLSKFQMLIADEES